MALPKLLGTDLLPETPWMNSRMALEREARQLTGLPVRLVTKEGYWVWRLVGWVLGLFSAEARRRFMQDFATTVGPVVALPDGWSARVAGGVLLHELQHVRQFNALGCKIHPWAGVPLMGLLYLLLPLPVGLAYFRYRLELDAERARWTVALALGAWTADKARLDAQQFADIVAGGSYAWAWPRRLVRRGFAKAVEKSIKALKIS